ncbi:MAG: DUF5132 domain-containing protein [Gammaproteobacteria bacterium]|jgi:hypothetical protein
MALVDDMVKGSAAKGMALGIGAALLVPVVLPLVARFGRPLARATIKSGIIVYEKGREAAAEFGEVMEDLAAEAKAELEEEHAAKMAAASGAATAAAAQGATDTAGESEETPAAESQPEPPAK